VGPLTSNSFEEASFSFLDHPSEPALSTNDEESEQGEEKEDGEVAAWNLASREVGQEQ